MSQLAQRVLLASSGQKPETPLNILQHTGYPPTMKNYPAQNVNGANIEKPDTRLIDLGLISIVVRPKGLYLRDQM